MDEENVIFKKEEITNETNQTLPEDQEKQNEVSEDEQNEQEAETEESQLSKTSSGNQERAKEKDPVKMGESQAITEEKRDEVKTKDRFKTILGETEKTLFSAKTFFPFDLFPDLITVYLSRIEIKYGEFLKSSYYRNFLIEEVKEVSVGSALIFSTLKINDEEIRQLKNKDACKLQSLIRGLVYAKKEKIDLLILKDEPDLTKNIEKLGMSGDCE